MLSQFRWVERFRCDLFNQPLNRDGCGLQRELPKQLPFESQDTAQGIIQPSLKRRIVDIFVPEELDSRFDVLYPLGPGIGQREL